MGNIQVGDSVIDQLGKPCLVTAVSDIQHRRCFDVEFDDGTVIRTDDVHRWLTFDASELAELTRLDPEWRAKRRAKRPSRAIQNPKKPGVQSSVTRLNSLRQYEYKKAPTGTVRSTQEIAESQLLPSGRRNHAVPIQGALDLPVADLPIDPYTLGVWLGDGSSSNEIIGMAEADMAVILQSVPYPVRTSKIIGQPKYITPFHVVTLLG